MNDSDAVLFADEGSGIVSLTLNRPKGNIIDSEMVARLKLHIQTKCTEPSVKAVILTGAGPNFSFGASVEEHLPATVAEMLRDLHGLLRTMFNSGVPFVAAIEGYCLGGGLELAAFCHRIFGAPGSKYGQPEIQLGVFAPVASVILPQRVGQAAADDLLLSGRTLDSDEALQVGLIDVQTEDPLKEALRYAQEHYGKKSASSLRLAVRASRNRFHQQFEEDIDTLETMYLGQLMSTLDAVEGIGAFLEKRQPVWSNS